MKSLKNLALLPVMFVSPMFGGQGVFDSLDPCIEAREQFQKKKDATLESVANRLAQINVEDARNKSFSEWLAQTNLDDARRKYVAAWWTEARKMLRATLAEKGMTLKPQAFEPVFNRWVADHGGADAINAQIRRSLDDEVKEQFNRKFDAEVTSEKDATQRKVAENLQAQENELHGACRMDVASQVLRAAIVPAVTLVPNLIAGNVAAAKHEPDLISQVVHGLSGISIPDIFKHGPLGGPTSEPNRIIQGMRDCNCVLGGEHSFFRETLGIHW
jgi:hypothetical protein